MKRPLKLLIVEDSRDDVELMLHELRDAGYDPECRRVSDAEAMRQALREQEWEIICSDHQMPRFSSRGALQVLKESGKDIPFILVSGSVGEIEAVEILRLGARDYVLKENLTRLAPAIERELQEARNRLEHRKAEESLKRTIKDLTDFKFALDQASILATTDARGVITYVNDKFCQISKFSREELVGKTHRIINSGYHPKEFFVNLWTTIVAGRVWEGEIRNRAKDGSHYWVHTFIVPFLDENKKPVQYVAIRTDITQRKEQEEKLNVAIQARDSFLSIASHELKTPLTSLKLQAQSMRRSLRKNDPTALSLARVSRLVDQVDAQTDRLSRLVDDMLDISRIHAGKLSIERSKMDLCEVVSEVCDRASVQFDALSIPLEVESCQKAVGHWDRHRIEQVILNLLTNALRYGKGKPVTVRVDRTDHMVRMSVRDRGIGIAAEDRQRIFERFERAISASEISGFGLGLFIVRSIVEAHQGKIWVESEAGQGSTFIVELPVIADGEEANDAL